MTLLFVLFILFAFLAIGAPVGFAMGIAGAVGLVFVAGLDGMLGVLQTAAFSSVSSYELITIPMFLLMAEFVLVSGVADDLFKAMAAWIGRVPGGLGIATALAGAGFGAICGTSTASAATLSSTSLPAMLRQGYDPRLAAGVVAISGTLAMLIPPSVAMVLYGLLAGVNIGKLLIAGIVPMCIITFTIAATIFFLAWKDPKSAPAAAPVPFREKLRMLRLVGPMLALFALVTGIIYTGIATPTEASAIGAVGAMLLAAKAGKLGSGFWPAVSKATRASCMIVMILLGASIFGYFFALTQVSQHLVLWVGGLASTAGSSWSCCWPATWCWARSWTSWRSWC
jgi:tripartite ATP-independent transporter DctM subunit